MALSAVYLELEKSAFKTVKENLGIHDMSLFGNCLSLLLADDYVAACIKCICLLYDKLITRLISDQIFLRYKLSTQNNLTAGNCH